MYILNDAIKNGKLKKGGTIVEGTAGNTGIGIAIIAKELGIKTVIVIPDTQSKYPILVMYFIKMLNFQ